MATCHPIPMFSALFAMGLYNNYLILNFPLLYAVLCFMIDETVSLSSKPPPPHGKDTFSGILSRRDSFFIATAAGASFAYVKTVEQAFARIDYPKEHEDRVRAVTRTTLATSLLQGKKEPLRVLEVGVGTSARLLRRGLYEFPPSNSIPIEITGMDIRIPTDPKVLGSIQVPDHVTFQFVQGSITDPTIFTGDTFDAILCCFTLCSVDDPVAAVKNMHRLLRPDGGVLGFVEHVAAPPSLSSLARQQDILDPLQQIVAHNCHLHRSTSATIESVFGEKYLQYEEFLVDSMWPVSYQASGVIQWSS